MCGRFVTFTVGEQLLVSLEAVPGLAPITPDGPLPGERYNIGPTMPIVALARPDQGTGTIAATVRWGLVPHWAREIPTTPYFNARAETWRDKPTFRDGRPCVIPMNGWYEWRDRQPYFVSLAPKSATADKAPVFAVAGLWARWGDVVSATILTTPAVGHLEQLHHRMPRVLADDEVAGWLDQSGWASGGDVGMTSEELVDAFSVRPVGRAVGNVANDGPHLLDDPGGQTELL
nr:SOS response-associated peptidase [Corynebacterium lactis]